MELKVINEKGEAQQALPASDTLFGRGSSPQERALLSQQYSSILDLVSREAAKHMIPRRTGRMIFTCSQLGYIGRERYSAYSAAKAGLIVFMRSLAKELAPHGILVNGVSPGLVDTGFDPLPEELKHAHAAGLPLGRLGTPEDMTSGYVFLASDEASYYCGQLLHPNGGEIMP